MGRALEGKMVIERGRMVIEGGGGEDKDGSGNVGLGLSGELEKMRVLMARVGGKIGAIGTKE